MAVRSVPTHLLFDFFGTLVDYSPSRTEQGYERSFAVLRAAGAELDYDGFLARWSETSERFESAAARTHREFSMLELGSAFLAELVQGPSADLVRRFVVTYVEEWNKGVSYPEGVPALVERLARQHELAVITNTHDPGLVPGHLERMGIARRFAHVFTSVELGVRKPAATIFEHAVRVLDVAPQDALYVGNSYEADYLGARGAGLRALLIDPESRTPAAPGDRIPSLRSLETHPALAAPGVRVRPYEPTLEVSVASLWHRAGRAAYPYLPSWQAFQAAEARQVFREVIARNCDVWVAEAGGRILAYAALRGAYLDRLYVDPLEQRRGLGTRLLEHAKSLQPAGLSLHTHQQNDGARAFYESHGFTVVRLGTSPAPESAPDVEYRWTPGTP